MPSDLSSGESRPRPAEAAAFRDLRDGAVILHLETGQYYGINVVGGLIWQLLDGERTMHDVALALEDQLEDPPANLQEYVERFVAALLERGLVTV